MAETKLLKLLGNRITSGILGLSLLVSSIYLVASIKVNFYDLLYETLVYFNPYFLYIIGIPLGLERLIYGITGNKKFSDFFFGRTEFTAMYLYFLSLFGIVMGIFIVIYSIALTGTLVKAMDIIDGVSFILFGISLVAL
ncbi:hypothetical protein [Acidianus hospitalis]|jgi:hypothetical protein|uniref:Uncharacterized protein n=1 Tax=Acidianus hospitalis (strain W1) TaxID=933801 RepID=F4B6M8_ACIHW|nr:hypothetical protein [Acidianus hospitalis]AEE93438.1 hypothetical protein Ahos_0550 [Acidianus hospitalis W1]MDT7900769.1 hypothetical protein [Acidianus sp.]